MRSSIIPFSEKALVTCLKGLATVPVASPREDFFLWPEHDLHALQSTLPAGKWGGLGMGHPMVAHCASLYVSSRTCHYPNLKLDCQPCQWQSRNRF